MAKRRLAAFRFGSLGSVAPVRSGALEDFSGQLAQLDPCFFESPLAGGGGDIIPAHSTGYHHGAGFEVGGLFQVVQDWVDGAGAEAVAVPAQLGDDLDAADRRLG